MKKKHLVFPLLLFLFCFFGSVYLFTIPGKSLPTLNWLKIPFLDKIIHIGIFFTLCFTTSTVMSRFSKKKISYLIVLIITLLLVSYGIGVEFYQENYVEGRSFEKADILADTFGCLLFVIWFYIGGFAKKSWPL